MPLWKLILWYEKSVSIIKAGLIQMTFVVEWYTRRFNTCIDQVHFILDKDFFLPYFVIDILNSASHSIGNIIFILRRLFYNWKHRRQQNHNNIIIQSFFVTISTSNGLNSHAWREPFCSWRKQDIFLSCWCKKKFFVFNPDFLANIYKCTKYSNPNAIELMYEGLSKNS